MRRPHPRSANSVLPIPDSFGEWLLARKRRLILPTLGAAFSATFGALSQVKAVFDWHWTTTLLLVLQAVVILSLLFVAPAPLIDNREAKGASIALRQFARAWRSLWLFWFIEFIILAAYEACVAASTLNPAIAGALKEDSWPAALVAAILNFANNLPTTALVICYIIASETTVDTQGDEPEEKHLPWQSVFGVLLLATVIDLVVRLNVVGHVIPVPWNLPKAFVWLSGITAGLATALVVGRLDSKFIGLPSWTVVALYGYAVIQPGWSSFSDPAVRAVLLNTALTLKLLLFVVVWWLFKSGVFLFYLERVRHVLDEVQDERTVYLARVQRGLAITAPQPQQDNGTHRQGIALND
jgi:hypothetical protein